MDMVVPAHGMLHYNITGVPPRGRRA
jgi:hypothetical protein